MISDERLDDLSEGWIREFSVDPYVIKRREMEYWHELDRLVYNEPESALRLFDKISSREMINWTFEGLAIGPLRTFLMVHGEQFSREIDRMREQNRPFSDMYDLAVAGL
jgi:hypothetical protein